MVAQGLVAFIGAVVASVAVIRLNHGAFFVQSLSTYEWWIVVAGAMGSALAFYLVRERFGHGGIQGVMRAIGGAIWVSFIGSIIAGTLALPIYGTMFGPFTLGVTFTSSPLLGAFWFGTLMSAHGLMRVLRAERDSIFTVRLHGARKAAVTVQAITR